MQAATLCRGLELSDLKDTKRNQAPLQFEASHVLMLTQTNGLSLKKKDEVKQHQQNGVSRTPRQRYLSSKTTPATAIVGDADLCACDDDVSGFLVPDHLVENVGDLQNDLW